VIRELGCELIVVRSTSGQVFTNLVRVACPMEVAGRKFKVNLICLPMEGLDVILGMDCFSGNHIVIDCGQHRLVFLDTKGLEVILTNQALKEIETRVTYFMIVAQREKKSLVEKFRSIPLVDEYVDVFLDEIPELLPSRDVDFTIDLIHGVGPISMTPYRMAPIELAELKK